MQHSILFRFILLVTCLFAAVCRGDIVTLKDGTVYEGVVIKETRAQVVIEITISNIKTTKTFPRYKVRSIEHKPVVSDNADDDSTPSIKPRTQPNDDQTGSDALDHESTEKRSKPARKPRTVVPRADRVSYIVIPVVGGIGEEVSAYGLGNALKLASNKKIKHVVFTIDSPGGFVYDAVETLKVLKEYDDKLNYYAVIDEGAISAASVYVAGADKIFVRPDARLGGAVAYSADRSTGSAEVDAKFNSIWAAEVASRAESKGYPSQVFRAMAVLEAEVWLSEDGTISGSRQPGKSEQIDSRTTILTMLASQMVKAGMATEFDGELNELGDLLGIKGWAHAKGIGERAMASASKERLKLGAKRDKALAVYRTAYEDLKTNDPRQHEDYRVYIGSNGAMLPDPESVRVWKARSQAAIRDCDLMLQSLSQLADVNRRGEKVGALHLLLPDDIGHDAYTEIKDARNWFYANRMTFPRSMYP